MRGYYRFLIFLNLIINICLNIYSLNAQDLLVVYSGDPNSSKYVRLIQSRNIPFISVNDFSSIFNTPTYFDEQSKKTVFYLDNKVIKISAYNPFILIDRQIYQLPIATIIENHEIYIPLNYFIELINKVFPVRIIYYKWEHKLEIVASALSLSNISRVEVEEKTNGTLVKIITTKDFLPSQLSLRSAQGWLYVDLYGGKVDSSSLYAEFSTGVIVKIVPSQISRDLAQIGFRLREEVLEKQLLLQNPGEILVSLRTKKDISSEITNNLEREKKKWRIDKIVIDAGHGGRDPGAIGKHGTKEKDVVLAIARFLKEIVEDELELDVLMTRDDDRFIELNQRTEFANRNQAKLFISIHANSNPNPKIRGVSTYFLGPEKTDEARQVASLENSVVSLENGNRYADLSQEYFILTAMAQSVYHEESQELAHMIQKEIVHECELHDLGVYQAGFYVLWGASMPNILIETGFISNPQEEKLLRNTSFQKAQAKAIFQSLKKFKEKYEIEL